MFPSLLFSRRRQREFPFRLAERMQNNKNTPPPPQVEKKRNSLKQRDSATWEKNIYQQDGKNIARQQQKQCSRIDYYMA